MVRQYALLDTDFISKAYAIKGEHGDPLMDTVIALQGYAYCCHEQVAVERSSCRIYWMAGSWHCRMER